jgi:hypothetical protein
MILSPKNFTARKIFPYPNTDIVGSKITWDMDISQRFIRVYAVLSMQRPCDRPIPRQGSPVKHVNISVRWEIISELE